MLLKENVVLEIVVFHRISLDVQTTVYQSVFAITFPQDVAQINGIRNHCEIYMYLIFLVVVLLTLINVYNMDLLEILDVLT